MYSTPTLVKGSRISATNHPKVQTVADKLLVIAKGIIRNQVLAYIDPLCPIVGLEASKPTRIKKLKVTLEEIEMGDLASSSSAQHPRMAPNVAEPIRRVVDLACEQPLSSSTSASRAKEFFDFKHPSSWDSNVEIFKKIFQVTMNIWVEHKSGFYEMQKDAFKGKVLNMINARFDIISKTYNAKTNKSLAVRSAAAERAVTNMRKKRVSE